MTQSTQNTPPIPRQPIGTTFVVAVCILGFFLIVQFLAVTWYFLPLLRQHVVESATLEKVPPATEPTTTAGTGTSAPAHAQPDQAKVQRVTRLVSDSDRAFRVGDYETALQEIIEAGNLLPDDPGILLRQARIFENMQQPDDAATVYAKVAALPGLSPELRTQAEKKLSSLGGSHTSTAATQTNPEAVESQSGTRDDTGLQPGATLGIVDSKLLDGTPGTKTLRVAIKSRPSIKVDANQMKMHVFFYERDEAGEIQLTESKLSTEWISPPINWADNEPEILDVTYILPDSTLPGSASSNGSPGRQFVGHIVAIFYNGELQDTRADPGSLAKTFPVPLYLKQDIP